MFQYLCLATSSCESFLAIGTSHKTVLIIHPDDFSSVRAFRIPKAPTCITFDNVGFTNVHELSSLQDSRFVIVGDRAGHVCRYSIAAPATVEGHKDITGDFEKLCAKLVISGEMCHFEGEPLMGAISMVLDVAITPDNRHLIVSDRDEKVRIHRYPNVGQLAFASISLPGLRYLCIWTWSCSLRIFYLRISRPYFLCWRGLNHKRMVC